MKARKLKEILNNTKYAVHIRKDIVCIGSPLCSELLTYNYKTKELKYALDTWKEGRKALKSEELTFIWDKLKELSDSGEIIEIIDGVDNIENPVEIWIITSSGKVQMFYTDEEKEVTEGGMLIYGYFYTREKAVERAKKDLLSALKFLRGILQDKRKRLEELENTKKEYQKGLAELRGVK